MRYVTCLLAAFCIPVTMICATDPPKLSPAEQEVVNVNKARLDAANRRDVAAWARYVADDYIYSDDDGALVTKARMMENLKTLPAAYEHSADPRDYVVHLYGSTAVINYRTTGHEQFGDTDLITEQRRTETFLKQNGSWLLIAVQDTDLPVNFRKPVAVDTSVYKDYVGHYEPRPGDKGDTVFVKDGKLWSLTGKDADECLPAGGETFFFKEGDLGTVTFSRDAQGHVTGYTYHRVDGQEVHAKKIK
jgi:ketosteroid isomerase-like protein